MLRQGILAVPEVCVSNEDMRHCIVSVCTSWVDYDCIIIIIIIIFSFLFFTYFSFVYFVYDFMIIIIIFVKKNRHLIFTYNAGCMKRENQL